MKSIIYKMKLFVAVLTMCYLFVTTSFADEMTKLNPYDEIEISEEDIDLMSRLIYCESRGENIEGQRAVAEVVLNRCLSSDFPDNVNDVIYQRKQFSTAKMLSKTTPNEENIEAVRYVLENGNTSLSTTEYVYFSTGKSNGHGFTKLGNHWFSK